MQGPEISRAKDVRVEVQSSTDLATWTAVAGQAGPGAITYTVPMTHQPQQFLLSRLVISE